jgi:hypothetical protein
MQKKKKGGYEVRKIAGVYQKALLASGETLVDSAGRNELKS